MSSRIALVTGGNTGLGYATILSLLNSTAHAYTVILGSRSLEKGQEAARQLLKETTNKNASEDSVFVVQIDIESDESVDKAFEVVKEKYGRLDVLINNAGAAYDMIAKAPNSSMTPQDAWTKSYHLNVTSTHFFTEKFIPLLLASSAPRILFISTVISSITQQGQALYPIDQAPPAGWPKPPHFAFPAYRSSKAAGNMMAREWARELKNDGVVVHLAGLGRYATAFGGGSKEDKIKMGVPDAKDGGEFIKAIAEGTHDQHAGELIGVDGVVPW